MAINDEENPRLITFAEAQSRYGNGRYIDLGVISAADVYAAGYIELLPAQVGRAIMGIRFLADNNLSDQVSSITFTAGNDTTGQSDGFGSFGQSVQLPSDTIFGDPGPLGVVSQLNQLSRFLPWTPNTEYSNGDLVIGGGHAQSIDNGGGTSGPEEPTWDVSGGTTDDGTITVANSSGWQDRGDVMSGYTATIHAVAEVITIPALDIPHPVSLQFIQQPTDVVAGENFDPVIQIQVLDQNGEPFIGQSVNLDLIVFGDGTFTGAYIVQGATDIEGNGVAQWDTLSMDASSIPGTFILMACIRDTFRSVNYRLNSDPFDVTAP